MGDGSQCVHPYYTDSGMCNLKDYSTFTDEKFAAIAFNSAYAYQEAVEAWKAVTAELSRLGQVAVSFRTAECAPDAGIIGVRKYATRGYIGYVFYGFI